MTLIVQKETPLIGSLGRFLLALMGVDVNVMRGAEQVDLANVYKTTALLALSATWSVILFANAFRIMLAPAGEWQLTHLGLALLVSAIVALADIQIFIAGSWMAHGIAELERTGRYAEPLATTAFRKVWVVLAVRFATALLVANFLAVIASLIAFDKEIVETIAAKAISENAALVAEKTAAIDAEDGRTVQELEAQRKRIAALEEESRTLREASVTPPEHDPEMKVALERLAAAEAAQSKARAARDEANSRAATELGGCADGACVAGRGPKFHAWQARLRAAEAALAEATAARDLAATRARELQEAREREAGRKNDAVQARLKEVLAGLAVLEKERADLSRTYSDQVARREARIRNAAEADLRYKKYDSGLISRLKALGELTKDEAIARFVYLADAVLIVLELATVIGKTVSFIPMTYATMIAERDTMRARAAADRMSGGGGSAPPPAPSPVPAGPQGPTSPGAPEKPVPPGGAKPAPNGISRRHAPRWKPPGSET